MYDSSRWIVIMNTAKCFQDVSDLTKNNCYSGYDGFGATAGWDPATGTHPRPDLKP